MNEINRKRLESEALVIAESNWNLNLDDLSDSDLKKSILISYKGITYLICVVNHEERKLNVAMMQPEIDEDKPLTVKYPSIKTDESFDRLITSIIPNITIEAQGLEILYTLPKEAIIENSQENSISMEREPLSFVEKLDLEQIKNMPPFGLPDGDITDREAIDYANEKSQNN